MWLRMSRAMSPARDAATACEIGMGRPPRGAARGLETHGGRFRPQQNRGKPASAGAIGRNRSAETRRSPIPSGCKPSRLHYGEPLIGCRSRQRCQVSLRNKRGGQSRRRRCDDGRAEHPGRWAWPEMKTSTISRAVGFQGLTRPGGLLSTSFRPRAQRSGLHSAMTASMSAPYSFRYARAGPWRAPQLHDLCRDRTASKDRGSKAIGAERIPQVRGALRSRDLVARAFRTTHRSPAAVRP